jgi:predicted nucleic acid-binding protein
MPINRVVVNASPLICLFKSGLADLLPVGVIVLAKRRELIPSIRESLEKLITAGLWLSSDFRDQVCRRFGE